jgi:hypothetical protein
MSQLHYFLNYYGVPVLLTLIIIVWAQKRGKKFYEKSFSNQQEMIFLLKEIRDAVKNKS